LNAPDKMQACTKISPRKSISAENLFFSYMQYEFHTHTLLSYKPRVNKLSLQTKCTVTNNHRYCDMTNQLQNKTKWYN